MRTAGINYHEDLQQVIGGQQLQQVSLQQVSVGQQQQQVPVGQKRQRVSEGRQLQQVSVGQKRQRVSEGQQRQQVSRQRVSVGQQRQQVSVGQQRQQVASGQHRTQKVIHSETLHLTQEQLRIINHKIKANHVVKIDAFEGAGKTTTLRKLCQERPHTRFLLLVPTKSLEEQCSQTFPINVTVNTAQSMALAQIGTKFSSINKLEDTFGLIDISKFIDLCNQSKTSSKTLDLVRRTIDCFMSSSNEYITLQHVPNDTRHIWEIETLTDECRYKVLSLAESVWMEMNRCWERQQISMTQDGLVKAWQLTKPRIQGYDVLLVDGAEDINDAVLDILLNQHCAKVFVGDSCQQLRFFGGTVSALDKVTATHKFSLSQSFRIATKMCEDKEYTAASMTFAGGLSKYGYDDVMDIFNLNQIQEGLATRESANIQNPLVAKFETIADLTNFAKTCEDRELLSKINMFHYSGSRTPYHVTLLTQRCNTEASEADICFSTVHMAKGLDWDWVILTDGIINLLFNLHDLYAYNDEMSRQAYVSSTRAKKFLTINNAVLYALLSAHDELDVLVARKSVQESVVCLWCHAPVTPSPSPLIIKALSYYISDKGYRFPGGYMSDGCATNAVVTSLTSMNMLHVFDNFFCSVES
ncbi:F-box DNA helicase 1-like [Procambarus clarkii]|uniref:F-box DNA helicase 1-like n=1 Tax=Procambarus clarkii TaxID=6728 RepID=UPI00374464D9